MARWNVKIDAYRDKPTKNNHHLQLSLQFFSVYYLIVLVLQPTASLLWFSLTALVLRAGPTGSCFQFPVHYRYSTKKQTQTSWGKRRVTIGLKFTWLKMNDHLLVQYMLHYLSIWTANQDMRWKLCTDCCSRLAKVEFLHVHTVHVWKSGGASVI